MIGTIQHTTYSWSSNICIEDMEALLTGKQGIDLHRSQKLKVYFHPEGTKHEAEMMARADGRL